MKHLIDRFKAMPKDRLEHMIKRQEVEIKLLQRDLSTMKKVREGRL